MYKNLKAFGLMIAILGSTASALNIKPPSSFSSEVANEYKVTFTANYRTQWTQLKEIQQLNESQKIYFKNESVLASLKYLYGPLTNRQWGSPQKGFEAKIDWANASLKDGRIYLPYTYEATWILHREFERNRNFQIPVPFNIQDLQTPQWKSCTDRDPEHQTLSFYWYFWDPTRRGCDQQLGREFQMADVRIVDSTPNLKKSLPEYDRLFRRGPNGEKLLTITLAFGYVSNPQNPLPEKDTDAGALQYQNFLDFMRGSKTPRFEETDITLKEYGMTYNGSRVIGHKFTGELNGAQVQVRVVIAAEVDQMDLFAKSFAEDHESLFAWFGHSRVGAGFDADRMSLKLRTEPQKYSISSDYQIIYWAGCSSYSYYTLPFFQMKTSKADPIGTKNLDIISNGQPSYFVLNGENAKIILTQILNWREKPTYQQIIKSLEGAAARYGMNRILINVLGDEDNP